MRLIRSGRLHCTVELARLRVTALLDGERVEDAAQLTSAAGAALTPVEMEEAGIAVGPFRLPVRAFAVQGDAGCLLVDSGAGPARGGRLAAALHEAGISPHAVTAIALTHVHAGHLGGLVDKDGSHAFPNAARVLVATEELAAFRRTLAMWPVLHLLMPLEQGDGPMLGVSAINAPGHSPGHMAYLVEGRLLIWGDLLHHMAQFARPRIGWARDQDPGAALASRLSLLEQAVEAGWLIAGAHLPDPGIGRIERSGAGYTFHPLARA